MSKNNKLTDSKVYRILMTLITWILTGLVFAFSVFTFLKANDGDYVGASRYMAGIFISIGLTHLFAYLKDRNTSFVRSLVMTLTSVGLGVLVLFAKYNVYIFSISAGAFAIALIVSRAFALVKRHTARDIVFNLIVIAVAVFLAIGFFQKVKEDVIGNIILLECLFISLCALAESIVVTVSHLKVTTFINVIMRTFALEILLGLVALIVVASLILTKVEPDMSNFPDALWYCFAVVTTIGFGDYAAVTPIGRVVTVVLGIYGIVFVAVLTSIIVNFYNETYGKKDAREIRNIGHKNNEK